MTQTHTIRTTYDEDADRGYWECSCGCEGSARLDLVDLHSDKHIPEDDHRVDRSGGRPW